MRTEKTRFEHFEVCLSASSSISLYFSTALSTPSTLTGFAGVEVLWGLCLASDLVFVIGLVDGGDILFSSFGQYPFIYLSPHRFDSYCFFLS